LIGVTHFTKGTSGREPIERITGSLAFGALARIVMVAAKQSQPEEESLGASSRLFARAKSNIGPDGDGFSYELVDCELQDFPGLHASRVAWGGFLPDGAGASRGSRDNRASRQRGLAGSRSLFARPALKRSCRNERNQERGEWQRHRLANDRAAKHSLGVQSSRVGGVAGAGSGNGTEPARNIAKPEPWRS